MKIYLFLSLFISSFRSQKVSGSEMHGLHLRYIEQRRVWRGVQHKADEVDDPGAAIMPGSGVIGLPGGSSNYASKW